MFNEFIDYSVIFFQSAKSESPGRTYEKYHLSDFYRPRVISRNMLAKVRAKTNQCYTPVTREREWGRVWGSLSRLGVGEVHIKIVLVSTQI